MSDVTDPLAWVERAEEDHTLVNRLRDQGLTRIPSALALATACVRLVTPSLP